MADDQHIWGNNRVVAPTLEAAIVAVDLGDNFTVKGHHLSMIKENKAKPLYKTAAFTESDENSPLLEKMEALTTRIDSQFKEIRGDMKEIRDGCNKCGGPHPSSDYDDKPIGGPKVEEANYASIGYQGNYYGRNPSNWRDHQYYHRDENQNLNPGEENPPILRSSKKRPDKSEFEKTMREFVIAQKTANDFLKNQIYNPKTKVEQGQKNHQAAIQDLETKFGRIFNHQSSRPMGTLPSNTQTNPKPSTSNEKPYRPLLAQNEHVNVVFTRNGMPNYGKFLKDLVSNKSKMEQIFVAFLTEECSAIIQNKNPPKLGDPESFIIPCKLANLVEYLALANLGASINLMPYSLYATLSGTTLKPTRMSIHLASHTNQYPMGVAENMLVQVGKFMFPIDFFILQMEEDDRVPLILGRPFLHTADAIIRLKNKELGLRIREDRATFHIDKAIQHSHVNDDTCFRMDVIDEIIEDELDDLLDNSKPFLNTSKKISKTPLDKE
nr:reverse transcriptase domain-containing protein [Tanacetum cinerariifolium]